MRGPRKTLVARIEIPAASRVTLTGTGPVPTFLLGRLALGARKKAVATAERGTTRRRDGLLTTGDMARKSGSTLRTVRFYEEAGILKPTQRTEGGHRLFEASELDKLRLVSDLRSAGFSLGRDSGRAGNQTNRPQWCGCLHGRAREAERSDRPHARAGQPAAAADQPS